MNKTEIIVFKFVFTEKLEPTIQKCLILDMAAFASLL